MNQHCIIAYITLGATVPITFSCHRITPMSDDNTIIMLVWNEIR